ncbi:MAG TPA: excinuclease ABC subunit C [Rhodospirillaceae bacterium]|nr:excinuclease ABC subunit C [Rhodospirillaceae bacterium]HAT34467.1 excinuclease ABC subunit C [Rhodospirillaceae bacterium]
MNPSEARKQIPVPAACAPRSNLARGIEVIEANLATLPGGPGVYRMQDAKGDALYVGKARNLKKRVAAYARPVRLPVRLQRMIALTESMEFITTHTEAEALLLESNLIKKLKPRYNVLLRDDKSFPYILITDEHDFAQVVKHRGGRGEPGQYFGPFASAGAVNRTITTLQRAFLLRNCSDHIFATRTRPCLQYQIKRCSAPCVGKIDQTDYAALVDQANEFLSGHSHQIQETLGERMQAASEALEYERAAQIRDRIRALTQVQAHQDINVPGIEDADIIAVHQDSGQCCIQVFFFRGGCNYGNRAYFPSHDRHAEPEEVLAAFLGQFYERGAAPKLILLSEPVPEQDLIAEALSLRTGHKVSIASARRGARRKLVEHARANARDALARRLAESASQRRLLDGLTEKLGLDAPPDRIEIYDNSHIQGENAVGGMVVSGPEGFVKNAYRKFNIRSEAAAKSRTESSRGGDDYEMMREVLTRRFSRALKEDPDRSSGQWPDLVILDGGKGQLSVAKEVFAELGIDDVALLAVSKGPDRDAGREQFHMTDRPSFILPPRDPVLHYLQRLRDEAHRFAIGSHRARRKKAIVTSPLDEIAGVGAKRKKALLMRFGSAKGVSEAGLADLEAVDGISANVAKKIYGHFHGDS